MNISYQNKACLKLSLLARFTVALFIILLFPLNIYGQELSLSASPPVHHIVTKPGKIVQVKTEFTNLVDPTTVTLFVKKLKINRTTGELEVETEEDETAILVTSSIEADKPFSLRTKESRETTVNISIPTLTGEKDFYYGLFIQSQPSPSRDGTATIKLKNTLGSLIMVTVTNTGEIKSDTNIVMFSLVPKHTLNLFGKTRYIFDTFDPIKFKLILSNAGVHQTQIQGKVEILHDEKFYEDYPLNNKTIYAESQTLVVIPSQYCAQNNDNCDGSLTIRPGKMGHYIAKAMIVDKTTLLSNQTKAEFYILPIRLTLMILSSIISVCALYFYISRRHKKIKHPSSVV